MTDDKQKTFDYLKHGFTQDDVVIRLTPQSKKSITQMIQLYNVPANEPGHRFVEIRETYRWGHGYMEGENLDWPDLITPQNGQTYCDPQVGHGSELDDLCAVWFDYDGEWTDEQKEEFEDRWYNGDPNDDDGRSGMAWLHDYQTEWQIEDDQIIIDGEVEDIKYDIMSKTEYNKVFIEDYKPNKEEDNG
jgi:hypothetical protein